MHIQDHNIRLFVILVFLLSIPFWILDAIVPIELLPGLGNCFQLRVRFLTRGFSGSLQRALQLPSFRLSDSDGEAACQPYSLTRIRKTACLHKLKLRLRQIPRLRLVLTITSPKSVNLSPSVEPPGSIPAQDNLPVLTFTHKRSKSWNHFELCWNL